jgi:hypothetical protein
VRSALRLRRRGRNFSPMTAEEFVGEFVAKLRAKAADLRSYGALAPAQTCERNAQDLEDSCRAWWLAALTVSEAARECGYSEERLRQMARGGELPHTKAEGSRGHIMIARRDLPRRPKALVAGLTPLEERLLERHQRKSLRNHG